METEKTNYLKIISGEITDYQDRDIEVVPGLFFNQKKNLEQIYFYYLSKFQGGVDDGYGNKLDEEGDKMYFYNVNRNPCKIMTKGIDFDTRNIRILTAGGGDPLQTWFFERDLKFWMKDKNFGKVLNRIFQDIPIYGTVVLKIINNVPYFVDLRNFVSSQVADTLDESPSIIERHLYTANGLRKVGKEMGWDSATVEETITKFRTQKKLSRYIEVYERYGEVVEDDGNGNYSVVQKRVFWANVGDDIIDTRGEITQPKMGVVLKEEAYDGHPYYEFHLEKIPGRWLGLGVVEMLFDAQMRQNELVNQEAKGTYWASLRVWQSASDDVNQNLATDVVQGQVLDNGGARIEPVDMAERNLAFFNEETAKWDKNINDMTIAFAPVGHSVIAVQIAQDNVATYFAQIQENIGLEVKELLLNEIIPAFSKESSPEHTLRIVGKDLDTIRQMLIDIKTQDDLLNFIVTKNTFPTSLQYDAMEATITDGVNKNKELLLTIPESFYQDLKYKIDIDITSESVDVRTKAATLFAAMQAITADPTILQDPTKRSIFMDWLEQGGVNISDIQAPKQTDMNSLINNTPGRAGGGISAPSMPQNPMAGTSQTTL